MIPSPRCPDSPQDQANQQSCTRRNEIHRGQEVRSCAHIADTEASPGPHHTVSNMPSTFSPDSDCTGSPVRQVGEDDSVSDYASQNGDEALQPLVPSSGLLDTWWLSSTKEEDGLLLDSPTSPLLPGFLRVIKEIVHVPHPLLGPQSSSDDGTDNSQEKSHLLGFPSAVFPGVVLELSPSDLQPEEEGHQDHSTQTHQLLHEFKCRAQPTDRDRRSNQILDSSQSTASLSP